MKFKCLLLAILCHCLYSFSQENVTAQMKTALEDGLEICKLHKSKVMAIELAVEGSMLPQTMRTLSYKDGSSYKIVFYYPNKHPKVFKTVSLLKKFDTSRIDKYLDVDTYTTDHKLRKFTDFEKRLYNMDFKTSLAMLTDTVFRKSANLIDVSAPIIKLNRRQLYLLSYSMEDSVMVLGEDYKSIFNRKFKLTSFSRLNHGVSFIQVGKPDETDGSSYGIHFHQTQSIGFTATEIALIYFFDFYAKWKEFALVEKDNIYVLNVPERKVYRWERDDFEREYKGKLLTGENLVRYLNYKSRN